MKALQEVIDITKTNILWGDLSPQYKGYQISNTGIVRSMKFFNKYPYGVFIEPKKNDVYELSNSTNQRVTVSRNELFEIVRQNGGFRISTFSKDTHSRNPVMGSKSNYIKKRESKLPELKQKVSLNLRIIDE